MLRPFNACNYLNYFIILIMSRENLRLQSAGGVLQEEDMESAVVGIIY